MQACCLLSGCLTIRPYCPSSWVKGKELLHKIQARREVGSRIGGGGGSPEMPVFSFPAHILHPWCVTDLGATSVPTSLDGTPAGSLTRSPYCC